MLYLASAATLALASNAQAPTFIKAWGTFGSEQGELIWPSAVAVDAGGNVYVAEWGNRRIQKFTNDGAFVSQWGTQGQELGQFMTPVGVAVSPAGDVYVTDWDNHNVQRFTSDGAFLSRWGTLGMENGQFHNPTGIAINASGEVYVVDRGNWRVQKFTSDGLYLDQWGSAGFGDGQFGDPEETGIGPWGIAVSGNGDVYVADQSNDRMQKFTGAGGYLAQWGPFLVYGVAVGPNGDVYVSSDDVVRIFTSGGAPLDQIGTSGAAEGQFDNPEGVAVDRSGNVFVADMFNNRIQKFGYVPTPAKRTTWGRLKSLYR
jgi:DNA-binding beta-propeller fold protein YncE